VKVEWGDGTATTIPAGESQIAMATHAYRRSGRYQARVSVLDAGGMALQTPALVRNVAPALTPFELDPLPAGEDGTVTLRGGLSDPGADVETVSVDWGDGTVAQVQTLDPATRRFASSHQYKDDGTYPVTVTVTDEDGGVDTRRQTAAVLNTAPSALAFKPMGAVTAGRHASFALDFTDPGTLDRHTATLDWGDGRPVEVLPLPLGARHFELPHTYTKTGTFPVKVTVADDDGASVGTVLPVQALSGS